jgi:inosine-uridine nucleoside N-ribohydrolase
MKRWLSVGFCLLLLVGAVAQLPAQAVPVIFDTDMGNDMDDALALAMLHALVDRGEAEIVAVTITKDNPFVAPYIDLVNHFYGRPGIPIGVPHSGIAPEDGPNRPDLGRHSYTRPVVERRHPGGAYVYPRRLAPGDGAPAAEVLRRALAAAEDSSVVVIQVGFSTNLARLLDSDPDAVSPLSGRDLVARKVRLLSVMAGSFTHAQLQAEYNIRRDIPAARKLFAEWPTPLVVSGFEIGAALRYPAQSIERDYNYVEDHPIAESYRHFQEMPYDKATYDLTSVLYALRPEAGYFDLSGAGQIRVDEEGFTHFRRLPEGKHRYLRFSADAQRHRVHEAMIYLASQPPQPTSRRSAAQGRPHSPSWWSPSCAVLIAFHQAAAS